MRSNARIANHPLHPMLIPLPIGLWVGSLAFDITYLSTGNRFWYAMAYWNMLAGVIGAVVAAIPGLVDYFTLNLPRHTRTIAGRHLALNVAAVALFLLNLWARSGYAAAPMPSAVRVFLFSLLLLVGVALSAWLGAHLVHVEQVSVVGIGERARADAVVRTVGGASLAGALGGEAPASGDDTVDR